jgi:hypothetical protein
MKKKTKRYSKSEVGEMSSVSIYMLMEQQGADVFGLYAAPKSELLKSYGKQIGFSI